MSLTMAEETVSQIRDDIVPLLKEHYEEVALHKDHIHLKPDWGRYIGAEKSQSLAVYSARKDGALVGYCVFLLHYHLHYVDTLVASNDVLFIQPEHRKGSNAIRLIQYSENQLKARGVDKILWHVKVAHDFRKLLHRIGYEDEEIIVAKVMR